MGKYTYPLIFGSFITMISATYIFRQRLLPEPQAFKAEADKFFLEDKDARQVLKQAMFEMRA